MGISPVSPLLFYVIHLIAVAHCLQLTNRSPVIHEDDLRHWSNGNLDVSRTASVQIGEDLVLACTPANPVGNVPCIWENPSGEDWKVDRDESQVVDENEEPVEGVEVWGDGLTCGILVTGAKMDAELLGDWSCKLENGNFTLLGRISTDNVVKTNLRLPETVVPINYQIDLFPDLPRN